MNHILTRYLINIFFISFAFTNTFEYWLDKITNTIDASYPLQLSMRLESSQISDTDNTIIDDEFYLRLNLSDNTYQIKYLDNIIYYSGDVIFQYNVNNNQLFKYFPDNKIKKYLDKEILKDFFNFNNYKIDNSKQGYQYKYDNIALGISNNMYVGYMRDSVNMLFVDKIYTMNFNNIEFLQLDLESYQNDLIINLYKDNKDIEIFDFTK